MMQNIIAKTVIILTILVSIAALVISIYPGVLNNLIFPIMLLSFLLIPVAAIVAIVVWVIYRQKGIFKSIQVPWRQIAIVFSILFCSYGLIKFYIPRRIAFSVSRASFENYLSQTASTEVSHSSLNHRLGVYFVDEYASDPRGGAYFRVYSCGDGIGPDQMSYGFVRSPNRQGTPFGAASYRLYRLGHDWYWFCASDDWF